MKQEESTKLVNNDQRPLVKMKGIVDSMIDEEIKDKEFKDKYSTSITKFTVIKEYIEKKLFALIMIIVSCALLYYTDLIKTICDDERVNNYYLIPSIIGYICSLMVVTVFCTYPPIANLSDEEWDSYTKKYIPRLSVLFFISMILLILSIWEIYEIYSVLIILVIKLGFVMTYQFAPSGILGNIIFYIILGLLLFSNHIIAHINKDLI